VDDRHGNLGIKTLTHNGVNFVQEVSAKKLHQRRPTVEHMRVIVIGKFTINFDFVISLNETLYSNLTTVIFIGEKIAATGMFTFLVAIYKKTRRHFPKACNLAGIWISQIPN
jgi:hypothetical protein